MTSPTPAPVSTSRWARPVDQLLDVLPGNHVERYFLIAALITTAVVLGVHYLLTMPTPPGPAPVYIEPGVQW